MNLDELALLMGKTRRQLEDELKNNDIIELKLVDKGQRADIDIGRIEVLD